MNGQLLCHCQAIGCTKRIGLCYRASAGQRLIQCIGERLRQLRHAVRNLLSRRLRLRRVIPQLRHQRSHFGQDRRCCGIERIHRLLHSGVCYLTRTGPNRCRGILDGILHDLRCILRHIRARSRNERNGTTRGHFGNIRSTKALTCSTGTRGSGAAGWRITERQGPG